MVPTKGGKIIPKGPGTEIPKARERVRVKARGGAVVRARVEAGRLLEIPNRRLTMLLTKDLLLTQDPPNVLVNLCQGHHGPWRNPRGWSPTSTPRKQLDEGNRTRRRADLWHPPSSRMGLRIFLRVKDFIEDAQTMEMVRGAMVLRAVRPRLVKVPLC